ncbi:hypothetical protein PR048_014525, partial [Dryococelus australis]
MVLPHHLSCPGPTSFLLHPRDIKSRRIPHPRVTQPYLQIMKTEEINELRKKDTIIESNEYHKVFAIGATVNVLGTDWASYNFMDALKKGLRTENFPVLPEENHISQKKRQDVEKFLKFVTLSEHTRMFYQNDLSDNVEGDQDNNIVVHDEEEPFVENLWVRRVTSVGSDPRQQTPLRNIRNLRSSETSTIFLLPSNKAIPARATLRYNRIWYFTFFNTLASPVMEKLLEHFDRRHIEYAAQ